MKPKYVADGNDVPDVTVECDIENGVQDTYCCFCRQGDFRESDPVWKIVLYRTIVFPAKDGMPGGATTVRLFPDGSMLYNKKMTECRDYNYKFHI